MTPSLGPATHLIQGITLAVVLALTTLVVMASEPGHPRLAATPASLSALAAAQPGAPLDVRVQMRSPLNRPAIVAAVRGAGGIPLGTVATGLRARMSAASAVALLRRPEVRGIVVVTR